MINALTIDVEPWHVGHLISQYTPSEKHDQIEESIKPILDLLGRHQTRATFFILGVVAEKYPEIVREIYDKGHEIASHGYSHKTLYELREVGFEEEVDRSIKLLESITGEKPIGFRAPSFSINNSTRWAFRVLSKYGFKYDSSIFPMKTVLYGVPHAPLHSYKPAVDDVTREDPEGDITEFPLTVLRLGWNIPVAGGFYLRVLPAWFLKFAIDRVNRKRPAVIYVHPWETYTGTPRVRRVPLFPRFVTYHGINSALKKMEALVEHFRFKPLREFLAEV